MEEIRWIRELVEQYESIPEFLSEIGCTRIKEEGNRWSASSPFREDKNPSFYMYKDTLHWEDPGNVDEPKGSINRLCWLKLHKSLKEHLNYNVEEKRNNAFLPKRKTEEKPRVFIRQKDYSPSDYELVVQGTGIDYNLQRNPEALEYARSRFMNDEFIDFFHIGYSKKSFIYLRKKGEELANPSKTPFYKRLIIPIIEDGVIASVEGRDVTRHQTPKCLYPASYQGSIGGSNYRRLFNIDNLDRNKPLIICEGIMDTVRIWQSITKNVTCTYGSSLKRRLLEDINEFRDVIVFSDSDAGGLTAMRHMDEYYKKDFKVAQLPSGDPGDEINTVDMLKRAIDNAILFPEWILKYTGKLI